MIQILNIVNDVKMTRCQILISKHSSLVLNGSHFDYKSLQSLLVHFGVSLPESTMFLPSAYLHNWLNVDLNFHQMLYYFWEHDHYAYALIIGKKACSVVVKVLNKNQIINEIHCVKSVRIRSYSVPYFPAFGRNMERYGVSLRTQSECGKMRTRIIPKTDTFHAAILFCNSSKLI